MIPARFLVRIFLSVFLLLAFLGVASEAKESFPNKGWQEYLNGDFDAAEKAWLRATKGDRVSPLSSLGLAVLAKSHGDLRKSYDLIAEGIDSLTSGKKLPSSELIVPIEVYVHHLSQLAPYAEGPEDLKRRLSALMQNPNLSEEVRARIAYLLHDAFLSLGQIDEAERVCREMGFLSDFLVIGPFDSPEKSGWRTAYPPEEGFHLNASYEGKRQTLSWKPLSVKPKWGYVNLWNLLRPQQDATAYLTQFIDSPEEKPVRVFLGFAGAAKLWLNGELLLGEEAYHPSYLDQLQAPATLKKGMNQILIKVSSDEKVGWCVMVRVTNPDGSLFTPVTPQALPEDLALQASSSNIETATGVRYGFLPSALQNSEDEKGSPVENALRLMARSYLFNVWKYDQKTVSPALDEIRKAHELFPSNPLVEKILGRVETDDNLARQALERAATSDPRDVEARTSLAQKAQDKPIYDQALADSLNALALSANYAPLLVTLGQELGKRDCSALARAKYEQAAKAAPHWSKPSFQLGQASTSLVSQSERLGYIEEALQKDPSASETRSAILHLLLNLGEADKAKMIVEDGLKYYPDDFSLSLVLVRWYTASGDLDVAESWASRALQICPQDPEANKQKGLILERKGDLENARKLWKTSLAIRPNDAWLQEYLTRSETTGQDYYTPFRITRESIPQPAEIPQDANVITLLDQQVQRVYSDGTARKMFHTITRVLNTPGIKQAASDQIYYVPSREKVQIREAKVITPNGQEIFAKEPNDRSALDSSAVGGGIYMDYNVMTISYDGVEKDCLVELEYEIQERQENLYSDYFGDITYIGSYDPTVICDYVLIFPSARKLYHKFIPNGADLADALTVSDEADARVYRWRYEQLPSIRREPRMPAMSEILPYLKVSTFATWNEMTEWYWNLSREAIKPDSTIKRKAAELVSDPSVPVGDKLRAVYKYVANDVRYLGLEFGIHGHKPHASGQVCQNQYGDCKDKAGLAVSLLTELGIPAEMVLLRTNDEGEIDYELPFIGLFNHAIFRMDPPVEKTEWLDGTAEYTAVGEIPYMDQGANALIIKPGGGFEFKRIPVVSASQNSVIYVSQLALNADGTASGERKAAFQGGFNSTARRSYQNEAKIPQMIERQFGAVFPGARVSEIQHSKFADFNANEWLSFKLTLPQFARQRDETLRFCGCLFPDDLTNTYAPLTTRKHELVNPQSWSKERNLTVILDEGLRVVELPKPTQIQTPYGKYESSWEHKDNKLLYMERLEINAARVPVDQYVAFRGFCASVDQEQLGEAILTTGKR